MADTLLGNLVWKITGDSTDFDKQITTSESKITTFSKKAGNLGKTLSVAVTAPLVALGGAAVKAASDLGESLNAVGVVFGESADKIKNFGEVASTAAGLSQNEFNSLATVIGAQLKQSGLDLDTVADSTIDLTQRAADLASVFNTDVKDAAGALGAALRGESEPARRFGITLSDAAVQAEALATGLVSSKSEITDQIKVQARYSLILKQSADVAGDFQNTSDSLANSTRILKADITNVAAELGQELLPFVTEIVTKARELVTQFTELDDSTKKTIVQVAAMAAAVGPLLLVISKLKGALASLTSPTGLAIAGVVALTTGVVALNKSFQDSENERRLSDLADKMEEIKDESDNSAAFIKTFADETGISLLRAIELAEKEGLITDEIRDQVAALKDKAEIENENVLTLEEEAEARELLLDSVSKNQDGLYDLEQAQSLINDQIDGAVESLGLSKDQIIAMISSVENLNSTYREALTIIDKENQELNRARKEAEEYYAYRKKTQEEYEQQLADEAAFRAQTEADRAAALEKEKKEREDLIAKRLEFWDEYQKKLEEAQTKERIGLIEEKDLINTKIKLLEDYVGNLISTGYADEAVLSTFIEKIKELKGLLKEKEAPTLLKKEEREDLEFINTEMEELEANIEGLTLSYKNLSDGINILSVDTAGYAGALKIVNDEFSILGKQYVAFAEEAPEILPEVIDQTNIWERALDNVGNTVSGTLIGTFDSLNATIFQTENAYESLGLSAVAAIAGIVDALGDQLIAQGTILLISSAGTNPEGYAAIAAGGVAKLAAAGINSSLSSAPRIDNTPTVQSSTTAQDVGVSSAPRSTTAASAAQPVIENNIYLDKEVLYKAVTEGNANGQIRMTE